MCVETKNPAYYIRGIENRPSRHVGVCYKRRPVLALRWTSRSQDLGALVGIGIEEWVTAPGDVVLPGRARMG